MSGIILYYVYHENRRSLIEFHPLRGTRKTVSTDIGQKSFYRIPEQSLRSSKKWCKDKKILTARCPKPFPPSRTLASNLEPAGFSPHCFSFSLSHPVGPHCSPVAPGCIEPFGTRITRVLRRRTRRETIQRSAEYTRHANTNGWCARVVRLETL